MDEQESKIPHWMWEAICRTFENRDNFVPSKKKLTCKEKKALIKPVKKSKGGKK